MSSKTATRSAAIEEEKKSRTASPAKDTKKKSKAADETKLPEAVPEKSDKEPKESTKAAEKTLTLSKSDKKDKTTVESKDAETKTVEKVTENKEKTKSPESKAKGKKEPEMKDSKEKLTVAEDTKKITTAESKDEEKASTSQTKEVKSKVTEPKSNLTEPKSKVPEPKSNIQEAKGNDPEPKSNGSDSKLNGSKVNGSDPSNGHTNGDTMEAIDLDNDDDCVMSGPDQDNDEHFPELSYDDTSDNDGFEPSTPEFLGVNRSLTRRSQAKSTATPETPKSLSRVTSAEPRSDSASTLSSAEEEAPKTHKTTEETGTMRLRSSDVTSFNEKSEEIPSQSDLNAANLLKTDTNFSKSRIKISPYRRGARPLDSASMIVNYTGNTSTLDDSFNSSILSDKTSDALESQSEPGQVSSLRFIKGRRSYKELREVTLRSVTLQKLKDKADEANRAKMESIATVSTSADTSSVPVAQVVGRKRRTSRAQDVDTRTDMSEVAAKRARLLQRVVVSPLSNLMSRGRSVLASSTPLTVRRTVPQMGDTYTDLPTEIAFDDVKTNAETGIKADSEDNIQDIDLEVGQSALALEVERKRCSIM